MYSLNHQLFLALNADETSPVFLIGIGRFLAEWPIGLAVIIAFFTLVSRKTERVVVMRLLLTVALAMFTAYAIRKIHYNPRPFVIDLGQAYISHAATSSFPSFHGTLLFSMAASLLFSPDERLPGVLILLLGFVAAWARIFLGVHYPLDMFGALVTAFLSAAVVHWFFHFRRHPV